MSDNWDLYLVPKPSRSQGLGEMKAVVELVRECYGGECRGLGYGLGLVYQTARPIPREDQEVLGIVPWV